MRSVNAPALVAPPAAMTRCCVVVHGDGVQERLPPIPIAAPTRPVGLATPCDPKDVEGNGLLPFGGCWNDVHPAPPLGLKLYHVPAVSTVPPSTSGAAPPYIRIWLPLFPIAAPTRAGGIKTVVVVVEVLLICSHPMTVPPARPGRGAELVELSTPSNCPTAWYDAGGEIPPSESTE